MWNYLGPALDEIEECFLKHGPSVKAKRRHRLKQFTSVRHLNLGMVLKHLYPEETHDD